MKKFNLKAIFNGKYSYFRQLLINFLLVLCVPILAIIFVYVQAETITKKQILLSNQSNLEQFFRIVDSVSQEMYETCLAVSNSEECRNYAYYSNYYKKKAPYQTVVTKKMLSKFVESRYQDVFVYFPSEDRIISGVNSSLCSEQYFTSYYSDTEENAKQEFDKLLECESRRPNFYAMDRESGESYICIAMKQLNYKQPKMSYVTVVVLKKGFFEQLVETGEEKLRIMTLFDENGNVLMSSDLDDWMLQIEDCVDYETFFETEVDEIGYMMLIKQLENVKGYCVAAINKSDFWGQLSVMRATCGWAIVLVFFVSIFIAYRNSMRAYRPITDMIESLKKTSVTIGTKYEEFKVVDDLIEEHGKEKKELKNKLKDMQLIRRNNILSKIVKGEFSETEDDAFLSKEGVKFCSKYFMVAIAQIETVEEMEIFSFIFSNVFEELLNREGIGYTFAENKNRYIILMNLHGVDDNEKMKEKLLEGKAFIKQQFDVKMVIGISDVQTGVEEICLAYKDAEKALKYQFILDKEELIEYPQIANRPFRYPKFMESRLFRIVDKYIKEQGEKEVPETLIKEIIELYELDENVSVEAVECFKHEFAISLNWIMVSNGFSTEESGKFLNELIMSTTMDQFCNKIVNLLEQICEKEKEKEYQNDVCAFAKQYIENHFSDSELSVTVVGEHMNISGSYLSRLFKEKYGISILKFITITRINNAKKALRKTEKSIQNIAEENGFLSSNVFIKSFKKQEGVTPGAYRRSIQNENNDLDD